MGGRSQNPLRHLTRLRSFNGARVSRRLRSTHAARQLRRGFGQVRYSSPLPFLARTVASDRSSDSTSAESATVSAISCRSSSRYRFLSVRDVDVLFVGQPDTMTPLGTKGVGELAITGMAAAIANAVYHATDTRVRS